jgi:hypothetical protein
VELTRRRGVEASAMRDLSNTRFWLVVAGAAALAVAGVGCNIVGPAVALVGKAAYEEGSTLVPAEYEGLDGRDFAVIVNADQSVRSDHRRLTTVLTNAVTRMLTLPEVGATGFVPGAAVLEFQYNNPSWPSWTYQRIADEFTVDRLVLVDVYEYRLHEPGNRFTWQGRAAARVGVFEANTGTEEMAYQAHIVVGYPDGEGFTERELSENAVTEMLKLRLVNRVGWLFFEHEEPNTIEY